MSLYDKILTIYPSLTAKDFSMFEGVILLKDDADGKGAYIAKWEHPTLTQPTDEQLASIKDA